MKTNFKREIIITSDGSKTIHLPDLNESYHSIHGAIQEAYHVFIKNGLSLFSNQHIRILEIGFGTGLNALITFLEHNKQNLTVDYEGVEAYPILENEWQSLDYSSAFNDESLSAVFCKFHELSWDETHQISDSFTLKKRQDFFQNINDTNRFDLIYFDAFGARVQPELWDETIFKQMYRTLKNKGVLTTYSAKGSVRRSMINCGFKVKKLQGPPGKREMLFAEKIIKY